MEVSTGWIMTSLSERSYQHVSDIMAEERRSGEEYRTL